MPQSPWVSSVAAPRPIRDWQQFPLKGLDPFTVFSAYRFSLDTGEVDGTPAIGLRGFIENVSAGSQRVYLPNSPNLDTFHFAARSGETALTVTRDIEDTTDARLALSTGSGTDGTIYGLVAQRRGRPSPGTNISVTNGDIPDLAPEDRGRSLAERARSQAYTYAPQLVFAAIRFKVDASGDPDSDTAFGWPTFTVTHDDDGEYTVTLGTQLSPGAIVVPDCDSLGALATVSGNVISITTADGGVAEDPAEDSEIRLLIVAPASSEGERYMTTVNTTGFTKDMNHLQGTYPAFALLRDAVLIPINFTTDSSGDIVAGAATVLPPDVKLFRDGTDYVVQIGACFEENVVAAFQTSTAVPGLPVDYSDLKSDGRLTISGTLTSAQVSGWILAGPYLGGQR